MVLLVQVSTTAKLAWTPCSIATDPQPGYGDQEKAECTVYKAPLCHPGICETPKTANATVDVFVKRFRAKNPGTALNVWLVQSGRGYSASLLDTPMMRLYLALDSKVNIYTMDYRGTGHSTKLTCEAAELNPNELDPSEIPSCTQELQKKFGDLAAFSTTTAATDLATFISDHGSDFSTTVYGVGYGITGYVLDGVFTTSGTSRDKFMNVSSLDAAFGEVSDAFLELCAEDKTCKSRFKTKGLKATARLLMVELDKTPNSTCSKLLKTAETGQDDDLPSSAYTDPTRRVSPASLCEKDVDVLTLFVGSINTNLYSVDQEKGLSSFVLDTLISISEMWESPTPSVPNMRARFEATTMSGLSSYMEIPWYCAFSKEKPSTCDKLKLGNYKTNGNVYERDEYWNKAAKIPKQASVLLLTSAMDPVIPSKYAKYLFEALDGDKKELATFKYAAQSNVVNTNTGQASCGMSLLTSFVQGGGDLD